MRSLVTILFKANGILGGRLRGNLCQESGLYCSAFYLEEEGGEVKEALYQWDAVTQVASVSSILVSTAGLQLQAGLFDGEETQEDRCAGAHGERTGHRALDPAV